MRTMDENDINKIKCLDELLALSTIAQAAERGMVQFNEVEKLIDPYLTAVFNDGDTAGKLVALQFGYKAVRCAAQKSGYSPDQIETMAVERGYVNPGEKYNLEFDAISFFYACRHEARSGKN